MSMDTTTTIPGWPCQCGHYRHDDGFCSGTLGTMLDLDGVRPEEDPSVPCCCSKYVPADADWARAVGFISESGYTRAQAKAYAKAITTDARNDPSLSLD